MSATSRLGKTSIRGFDADEEDQIYRRADRRNAETKRGGMKTADLCRQSGISEATFYNWKAKYSGMAMPDVQKLKRLADENGKLKPIVADLTLDNTVLKDLLAKNF